MKLLSLLPLASLALLSACGRHTDSTATAPDLPPAQVRIAAVQRVETATPIAITGSVRPVQRAVLAAKVMGAIDELPVALGQRVRAGDLVAKIAAGEISARVLQAQSQLNLARRDLTRERDLLEKGASTADLVKGLEDRFAMTEAMVHEAEAMLAYTTLRAPFDGVISRKLVDAGDLAAPGQPLLEIEGTDAFEIDAALPDSLAANLALGTSLTVAVPAAHLTFSGKLAELSSAADPAAHTVAAKISVPPGTTVRSGQFVRVELPGAPSTALLISTASVSTYGQLERVWVATADRRAALRLVKSGATRADQIEILTGLDAGEQVILAPPADLQEGKPLTIVQ